MSTRWIYYFALALIVVGFLIDFSPQIQASAQPSQAKAASAPCALQSLGLSGRQLATGGICNIERLDDALASTTPRAVKRGDKISLSGWGIDSQNGRIPEVAMLKFSNPEHEYVFPAIVHLRRPDVVRHFKLAKDLSVSGFDVIIPTGVMEAGEYSIVLIMPFDNTGLICDNGRKILLM